MCSAADTRGTGATNKSGLKHIFVQWKMLKKGRAAFKAFPHINSVKKRTVLPASSGRRTENQRDLVTLLKSHRKAAAEQRMKSALATSRAAELSPQQTYGMGSSILLAICALSSDITAVIHYAMCNETVFFFPPSFMFTSLYQVPCTILAHICYWGLRQSMAVRRLPCPLEGHPSNLCLPIMCWATAQRNSSTTEQWVVSKRTQKEDAEWGVLWVS